MAKLSIITPTFDEAGGIREQPVRLQRLRARGVELIVVDGGSRDDTPIRARPLVDCLLTAPWGRARQMNAGAALGAWWRHPQRVADVALAPRLLARRRSRAVGTALRVRCRA